MIKLLQTIRTFSFFFLVLVVFCHLGWVAIIGDGVNEEFNIGCSAQQILLLLLNSEQGL
jgi:hypothetical protein